MKRITLSAREHLEEACSRLRRASKAVALTGAGISVESGIDDFRSPGGLWSRFSPDEYATLDTFKRTPEKSWRLFRSLGKSLEGKRPNAAHTVLAELERRDILKGVVTQNVDNLHQDGGSSVVLEIHGDHRHLQCLRCGDVRPPPPDLLESKEVPECDHCRYPLKPNVVLFGENVRHLDAIQDLLYGCDALLVIGTSAQVYPAASFPEQVKAFGGVIFEFNTTETVLTGGAGFGAGSVYFFQGGAGSMLRLVQEELDRHE